MAEVRASGFSDPSFEVGQLLNLITGQQFPTRLAGFMDVLNAFQQRAAASPQALGTIVNPDLQKMAAQILAASQQGSQTFGPFAMPQYNAAMGRAFGQQPVLQTFVNPAVKAGQSLASFLQGAGLIAPSGQTRTEIKNQPEDVRGLSSAISSLVTGGRDIYKQFFPPSPPMQEATRIDLLTPP